MSKAMSDIPVADGLTVNVDGLSWKFRIQLRTVRGERADLYAACSAALQSAVEGMAPNERATWNGRLTGQQGDVLRYGIHKYIDLKERKSSGCRLQYSIPWDDILPIKSIDLLLFNEHRMSLYEQQMLQHVQVHRRVGR